LPSIPEVGAVCGKAACTDLCGGREVTRVPTAKPPDLLHPAQVWKWHDPEIPESANYFRLLRCCGPKQTCRLTDRCQFDMLRSNLGLVGTECDLPTETARVHHGAQEAAERGGVRR
jgi:hypothetical protein